MMKDIKTFRCSAPGYEPREAKHTNHGDAASAYRTHYKVTAEQMPLVRVVGVRGTKKLRPLFFR
jgi:hypothetical protein